MEFHVAINEEFWCDLLFRPEFRPKVEKYNAFLTRYDLSFASTETKYIKLKTKTQNNIVIFSKNDIVILAFFGKIWLKYECLQKNQQF